MGLSFTHDWKILAREHGYCVRAVARVRRISERTWRRHWQADGFRRSAGAAFTRLRRADALRLLRHADRDKVEYIAARLGYAHASAFIAAFRRWYGVTPGQFQRAHAAWRALAGTRYGLRWRGRKRRGKVTLVHQVRLREELKNAPGSRARAPDRSSGQNRRKIQCRSR